MAKQRGSKKVRSLVGKIARARKMKWKKTLQRHLKEAKKLLRSSTLSAVDRGILNYAVHGRRATIGRAAPMQRRAGTLVSKTLRASSTGAVAARAQRKPLLMRLIPGLARGSSRAVQVAVVVGNPGSSDLQKRQAVIDATNMLRSSRLTAKDRAILEQVVAAAPGGQVTASTVAAAQAAAAGEPTVAEQWEDEQLDQNLVDNGEVFPEQGENGEIVEGEEEFLDEEPTLWGRLWPAEKPIYKRPATWIVGVLVVGGIVAVAATSSEEE